MQHDALFHHYVTALSLSWPTFYSTCYQALILEYLIPPWSCNIVLKRKHLWCLLDLWDPERKIQQELVALQHTCAVWREYRTWVLEQWDASSSTGHRLKGMLVRCYVFIFAIYSYTFVGICIFTYSFVENKVETKYDQVFN